MNRREFCIVSGGALLGTSGCLEAGFEQGLRLGGVVLANQQASDIVVQLRIQQGDTTVVDSEYSLEPSDSSGSGITIDDAWSDRVDQYTVTVDLTMGREILLFSQAITVTETARWHTSEYGLRLSTSPLTKLPTGHSVLQPVIVDILLRVHAEESRAVGVSGLQSNRRSTTFFGCG
jgi:hypothetical protein